MNKPDRIAIVGAGIGGLAAALALLQRGIDVDIYEQAPALGETGAGVQISANGTRVLMALGLERDLLDVCFMPAGKEIRLWSTGTTWTPFDLGAVSLERYGAPYVTLHRADLHGLLARAVRRLKGDAITLGARCVDIQQSSAGVVLSFTNGTSAQAQGAIGADGVHSRVRASLFGAEAATFTGCVAWRGVVPVDRLPAGLVRPVGTNWIGPGRHFVHYPLRRGELLNFVGIVERHDWQIESWSAQSTSDECLHDFNGWHHDIQAIIASVATPYKWALMGREPMAQWSLGRVTLLGDACHPTLPFLAQGAVMAIEDAYVLARALEMFGDCTLAFERYETARKPRTSAIVKGSATNTQRFHNERLSDASTAHEYINTEWSEERVRERYEWLFVYDATTVRI
jgi:salicylate hydroxylase